MEGLAVEPVHIDQVRKPEVAPVKEIERKAKKTSCYSTKHMVQF